MAKPKIPKIQLTSRGQTSILYTIFVSQPEERLGDYLLKGKEIPTKTEPKEGIDLIVSKEDRSIKQIILWRAPNDWAVPERQVIWP